MEKNELILSLARCTFLTCNEKEFLAKNLDNLQDLTVLSIEDISVLLGRFIRTRCWNPLLLRDLVHHDLEMMHNFGISSVSIMDEKYPPLLREIHDPPFVIFWRGTLPNPERPLVAIVGTRSPTGDASIAASQLGREFACSGVSVVSGLARGIDAFAHRGNVDGGGRSVAVLACGVDTIYPRSNCLLAKRMVETGGCILGEYSPGEVPLQYRFPQRNRIISGLSRAVVVVEAPQKSGALITADFALEQGRDLFVYKGTLESSRGAGCLHLADQGATAIISASDVLSLWGYQERDTAVSVDAVLDIESRNESLTKLSVAASIGRQLAFDFKKELAFHEQKR